MFERIQLCNSLIASSYVYCLLLSCAAFYTALCVVCLTAFTNRLHWMMLNVYNMSLVLCHSVWITVAVIHSDRPRCREVIMWTRCRRYWMSAAFSAPFGRCSRHSYRWQCRLGMETEHRTANFSVWSHCIAFCLISSLHLPVIRFSD